MRRRLWLTFLMETFAALLSCVTFGLTLVWKDWLEIVFHIDPDSGNGSIEWLIVGVAFAATVALAALARHGWRRIAALGV